MLKINCMIEIVWPFKRKDIVGPIFTGKSVKHGSSALITEP